MIFARRNSLDRESKQFLLNTQMVRGLETVALRRWGMYFTLAKG